MFFTVGIVCSDMAEEECLNCGSMTDRDVCSDCNRNMFQDGYRGDSI